MTEQINRLDLEVSKSRMEWQFKEEKFAKEIGYAKEKHATLEGLKMDLQTQLGSANNNIATLKQNQKNLNEKVQKMELEAIQSREMIERLKKDIKILEEKLHNSDNNLKAKAKELTEQYEIKETLDKELAGKDGDLSQLKNELKQEGE